jgi:ABC-type enterochelin transport system ATPase subunit
MLLIGPPGAGKAVLEHALVGRLMKMYIGELLELIHRG